MLKQKRNSPISQSSSSVRLRKQFMAAAVLFCFKAFVSGSPALAQYGETPNGVSMTIFQVVQSRDGQEAYLNQFNQPVPLPGAGVNSRTVSVYTAPDGSQWYIDSTGTRQSLPPAPTYGNAGNVPVQNNYYYSQPQSQTQTTSTSTSSSTGGGGVNLNVGLGGFPTGVPMYWGTGGPYYVGAGGNAVYVNRNVNNFSHYSQFNQETNNWNRTNNNYWSRNNFNHNNWNNHWGHDNWPGKDHGFPPPNDRVPGRLYSGTADGGFNRHGGDGGFDNRNFAGTRGAGGLNQGRDGGTFGGERRFGDGGPGGDGVNAGGRRNKGGEFNSGNRQGTRQFGGERSHDRAGAGAGGRSGVRERGGGGGGGGHAHGGGGRRR